MSLQTNKLTLSIAGKSICKNLTVNFKAGQFWGIMGVNGVGKTTLLQSLIGLIEANSYHNSDYKQQGAISLFNKLLGDYSRLELAQKTGFMLQEYEYNFPSTVLEATLIGRHPFLNQWQIESTQDKQLAISALKMVGLDKLSHRRLNTLSGGERRRVNLATLLTQNPDYYLLDEPVNHLDIKAQMEILTLLKNHFQTSKHGGIMVIHDPNLAYRYCDHVLFLFENGQWLSGKTSLIMNQENLSHLYGCGIKQIGSKNEVFFSAR